MRSLREWLFKSVAAEFTLKGAGGLNLKQLAGASGLSYDELHEMFPARRSVMKALVSEICEAQTEHIFKDIQTSDTASERLTQLLVGSLDFVGRQPRLANVIELALLGSDDEVKEHVFLVYGQLFGQFLDDMLEEGVIQTRSRMVATDVSEVLLAVIFLGGSPVLQMDYLSFVDAYKVALSTIEAMKRRYALAQYR